MATTIGDLRARRDAARQEASESEARYEAALLTVEARGYIDAIEVPDAPEHRLLTDEEAVRRVLGEAPPDVAREIAEAARDGLRATDRAYAENNAGA